MSGAQRPPGLEEPQKSIMLPARSRTDLAMYALELHVTPRSSEPAPLLSAKLAAPRRRMHGLSL